MNGKKWLFRAYTDLRDWALPLRICIQRGWFEVQLLFWVLYWWRVSMPTTEQEQG